VSVDHRHPCTLGGHGDVRVHDLAATDAAQDLPGLDLYLLLLAGDEWDHVVEQLQARHTGEPRTRDSLECHHVDLADPERAVEWREGQREADGRTVRIGDDPASVVLRRQEVQVFWIHLRHEQRHDGVHAVVLGVRYDHRARPREVLLYRPGDRRVKR